MSDDIQISDRVLRLPLRTARRAFERAYIQAHLDKADGNVARAADAINFDRCALHRKIRQMKRK